MNEHRRVIRVFICFSHLWFLFGIMVNRMLICCIFHIVPEIKFQKLEIKPYKHLTQQWDTYRWCSVDLSCVCGLICWRSKRKKMLWWFLSRFNYFGTINLLLLNLVLLTLKYSFGHWQWVDTFGVHFYCRINPSMGGVCCGHFKCI